jgi:hypothetical protein
MCRGSIASHSTNDAYALLAALRGAVDEPQAIRRFRGVSAS